MRGTDISLFPLFLQGSANDSFRRSKHRGIMAPSDEFKGQKLLIANRGEIAYRILRTAKRAS